jgi:hypothetical protein
VLTPPRGHQEIAHIAFPLAADVSATALATALARSPRLGILRTQLPVVWSPVLLIISENPSLAKIELWNLFHTDGAAVIVTGLFLKEASRHQRLVDLINAGTLVPFLLS